MLQEIPNPYQELRHFIAYSEMRKLLCIKKCVEHMNFLQNTSVIGITSQQINSSRTLNSTKKSSKEYYTKFDTSWIALFKVKGCPKELFTPCNLKTPTEKEEKIRNEKFNFFAECGNKEYFISKSIYAALGQIQACCEASLIVAEVLTIDDLNCLRNYSRSRPDKGVNIYARLLVWDSRLNRNFTTCPGGKRIPRELWAPREPNECEPGSCTNFSAQIHFCSDCETGGYQDESGINSQYVLCMALTNKTTTTPVPTTPTISETTTPNRTLEMNNTVEYYTKTVVGMIKLVGIRGCPPKIYQCNSSLNRSNKGAKTIKNKNLQFIDECGNKAYFLTKSVIDPLKETLTCCKAGLVIAEVLTLDDLNCLRNYSRTRKDKGASLKPSVAVWDTNLNRNFTTCPGGKQIPKELWAAGEPGDCKIGSCTNHSTHLNLCYDCANAGYNDDIGVAAKYVLCMEVLNKTNSETTHTTLNNTNIKFATTGTLMDDLSINNGIIHKTISMKNLTLNNNTYGLFDKQTDAGVIKNKENKLYIDLVYQQVASMNSYKCNMSVFECKFKEKKDLTTLHKMYFRDVVKCSNKTFYISRKKYNHMSGTQLCCESNLYTGEVLSFSELECLSDAFSGHYGHEYLYTSAWDVYLNRTFLTCPGLKTVPNKMWRKGEPNNLGYIEYYAIINVCRKCREYGYHDTAYAFDAQVLCQDLPPQS